jgi:hypothetical protein
MSCGPLPAARPPSEWQKPQVDAKSCPTSNGALSGAGGAAGCCAAAGTAKANDAASTAACNAVPFNFDFITRKSSYLKPR